MVCTTITIAAQDKKYECVNNQCTESPTGTYINDPTCGGTCQAVTPPEDNTIIYLGIATVVGFLLLRKQ